MEEDITKDQIRERIKNDWQVADLEKLEASGDIIITTAREWYYPDGNLRLDRISDNWQNAIRTAKENGKRGMRAFGTTDAFFRNGLLQEFVNYELSIGNHLAIDFIGVCAYKTADIRKLNGEQLAALHFAHNVQLNTDYSALKDPLSRQRIALVYDTEDQMDWAVAEYINEGLDSNQLCVFASVKLRDSTYRKHLATLINNFEKNAEANNLILVDLGPHYIAALTDEFDPFENLLARLNRLVSARKDKRIRLVTDCEPFLFEKKHFDECLNLQAWWNSKQFEGTILSAYPKNLFKTFPHDMQAFRVLRNYDIVSDHTGKIVSAHFTEKGGHNWK